MNEPHDQVHALRLETLHLFNGGRAAAMFDHHLASIIEDCLDRPAESKPRKLTLQLDVTPHVEQGGAVVDVRIACHCKPSIPTHKTAPTETVVRRTPAGSKGHQATFRVGNEHQPDLFQDKDQ